MLEATTARHEQACGLGPEQHARLRHSCVAIVGVGALGGPLAEHLTRLGVGTVLVDPDTVCVENLANQSFDLADIGKPKAAVRERDAHAIDPHCDVQAIVARVEDVGLGSFLEVDLIVTALDSVSARGFVSEIAAKVGVPLLDIAVDGSDRRLQGHVAAFDPTSGSPCYLCQYDPASYEAATRDEMPRGCASWLDRSTAVTPPTLQGSAFGGLIASAGAIWSMRILTGRGDELFGRKLLLSMQDPAPAVRLATIGRREGCLIDHEPLAPVVHRAAEGRDETIGDSVAGVERAAGAKVLEARLHHRSIARGLFCRGCGAVDAGYLHVAASAPLEDGVCRRCGEPTTAAELTQSLDRVDLGRLAVRSWHEIGLPENDLVTLVCDDPERREHQVAIGHFAEATQTRAPGTGASAHRIRTSGKSRHELR
jgi:molybdopterin/thiamine biosynthesis adenylyltransferase